MGACCNTGIDEHTRYINDKLASAERKDRREHKLLFLGPGDSGKSTIFKQLQWLYSGGLTKEDTEELKRTIYQQIITQMQDALKILAVLSATAQNGNVSGDDYTNSDNKTEDEALQNCIKMVSEHQFVDTFSIDLGDAIKYIWENEAKVQNIFDSTQSGNYNKIFDSTQYFLDNMDRIKVPDFIPNEVDILHVRNRTTGAIIDKKIQVGNANFCIIDVGGQRSERSKWTNFFDEAKAVIFVVSLSSYNQNLFENELVNCMEDSLELFGKTVKEKMFVSTHFILFLNKRDLFRKKISAVPITPCPVFQDFEQWNANATVEKDPHNYDQCTAFVKSKFQSVYSVVKNKQLFTHLTCAMDKHNVESVFNDVRHIVISNNLYREGLS